MKNLLNIILAIAGVLMISVISIKIFNETPTFFETAICYLCLKISFSLQDKK